MMFRHILSIGTLLSTAVQAVPWNLPPAAPWTNIALAASSNTIPGTEEVSSLPPANSCGDLIRQTSQYQFLYASDVYDCFQTVPFNPAVATRLIKYWNDTIQFHSTLGYLKKPPQGYQKPAVDLVAGLQQIQSSIDSGTYQNEYHFEADLQRLLISAGDAHLYFYGGILGAFTFASPWDLSSVSSDGVALPQVYFTDDLYLNQSKSPQDTWQPSPLVKIDSIDATEYLSNFAVLNAQGTLEPHSDWNVLMDNPVADVLDIWTPWSGSATFYPGDEIVFTFANGTVVNDRWLAIYNNAYETGPLETGGDFYNFFVLGWWPASYTPPNDTDSTADANSSPASSVTSFETLTVAYPDPDVYQANLTVDGYLTGYFLPDTSLAILSIPSFGAPSDGSVASFTATVQTFLSESKQRGMSKVVIDLQRNSGGATLLAYSTFKQFFPSIDPFAGSEMRAHDLADLMGSTLTKFWTDLAEGDELKDAFASDEWIVTDRIDAATGEDFSSWDEFFGPEYDGVDYTTRMQRLNISNDEFTEASLGVVSAPPSLKASSGDSPYSASDIIILSDAICSSACALFLEMMRHDAGVRNIVVGGRPSYGPMQTPSGSRGARVYSMDELDTEIDNVAIIRNSTVDLPNRGDQNVWIHDSGFNLRSQTRPNNTVPLQMIYEAADCRIFYTPATFNNFTNLWNHAAAAAWNSPQYCVQNSTGYSNLNNSSPLPPPPITVPPGVNYQENGLISLDGVAIHDVTLSPPAGPMPDDRTPPATLNEKETSPDQVQAPAHNQNHHVHHTSNQHSNDPLKNHKKGPPTKRKRRRSLTKRRNHSSKTSKAGSFVQRELSRPHMKARIESKQDRNL